MTKHKHPFKWAIKSMTSGRKLPVTIISKSWFRFLFWLPSVEVEYLGTNLSGPVIKTDWVYPGDLIRLTCSEESAEPK